MNNRVVIVNADDFGRTPAVNRGIVRAHREGIVTSTSLMVLAPWAGEAVALARSLPDLALGLHVELTDWAYREGAWHEVVRRVDLHDGTAVDTEVARQVTQFEELVGRRPEHLDSHQHVHRLEPARSVFAAWGERLGVRVRDLTPGIAYRGDFYGQHGGDTPCHELISAEALIALLESLPTGVTEIGCHPGEWPDPHADGYGIERGIELASLCDGRVDQSWLALLTARGQFDEA